MPRRLPHSPLGSLVVALFAGSLVLSGCGGLAQGTGGGTATTRAVALEVNVDLTGAGPVAEALAKVDQTKVLRAFLLDGSNTQVQLRQAGASGTAAAGSNTLPVTFTGVHASFAVEALLPLGSGEQGLLLQLQGSSTQRTAMGKLAGQAMDDGAMAALVAASPAGGTTVSLTPTSTLATFLVAQTLPAAGVATRLAAFAQVHAALVPAQAEVEGQLVARALSFDVYNAALYGALAGRVLLDGPVQQAVARALRRSADAATEANAVATAQALAARYDDALLGLGLAARTALGTGTTAASQAFDGAFATTLAQDLVAQSGSGASLAYTPRLLGFTDTDYAATIAGKLVIGPAPISGGITGYNVYLGGKSLAASHGLALGSVAISNDANANVTFVVPAKTAVPAGMDQLWAFPVSIAQELAVGDKLTFLNVTVPTTAIAATPGPNRIQVSWTAVAGASGYNLYRGTQLPLTEGNVWVPGATAPYTDTDVDLNVPVHYGVNVVQRGVAGPIRTTPAVAPNPSAPPVLTATPAASGGNVQLSWTGVDLASSYTVYLDGNAALSPNSAQQGNLLGQVLTVAVPWGQTQYAAVTATLRGRETPLSNAVQVRSLLAPPQQVNAFSPGAGEVQLAWLPVPGAVAYRIYSATHTGLTLSDAYLDTPTNLVVSQDVTNSVVNTFAVLALDSNGFTSQLSREVNVVPGWVPLDNGVAAATVLGQADGNTNGNNPASTDAVHFTGTPAGLAWNDALATLFVADVRANRVLGYLYPPLPAIDDANVVLGQADATTRSPTSSAQGLNAPAGGDAHDPCRPLWVADANNGRVLGYANVDSSGASATVAVGGPDANGPGRRTAAANGFVKPTAVCVGGGKLVVVDSGGHRVLLYNQVPSAHDAVADVVLGQPDFASTTANNGNISAASLNVPSSAYTDGNTLIVYDSGNSRVLIWHGFPTSNMAPADTVLGQPDMVHGQDNGGSANATATGLAQHHRTDTPLPQLACNGAALAVADPGNNRVLLYAAVPTQSFAAATGVLGQALMTTRTSNNPPQQNTLSRPTGVAFAGATSLFVADTGNNRVLRYGRP